MEDNPSGWAKGWRYHHWSLNSNNPLIIPTKHHITRLILEDTHNRNQHASGQLLLEELTFIFYNQVHLLQEAGIKLVNFHLQIFIGNACLTFEEFNTVLCQVEACLNSRPLYPLSNDPMNLQVLTPGYFLIGSSMLSLPDPNLLSLNANRLSRFSRSPSKCGKDNVLPNLVISSVLLIKDNLPPLVWEKGIVTEIYPGTHELVCVATIKTATGELKSPVDKLCLIPMTD
ncbi:hypothetical protein PR048_023654 [Dryococelus australis]|uniref:DUF5641 domain-containing protein n=1 Tax=Dryococelus australis TaxID=614101 RepID=A0ABQ9GUM4_9NEOP|nr:hypothetical protein PR048_023654 [Dryococelus australis]